MKKSIYALEKWDMTLLDGNWRHLKQKDVGGHSNDDRIVTFESRSQAEAQAAQLNDGWQVCIP